MKSFLLIAAAMATLCFAGTPTARTYKIELSNPAKVGATDLMPGEYRLALVGETAVRIVDAKTGKGIEVPVTVQNAEKKFDNTSVNTESVSGANILRKIQIGGTKLQLEFR